MVAAEQLDALRSAVGEAGCVEHEPIDVDGAQPAVTLRPADAGALAATLAALSRSGLSALVRGGGQQMSIGNTPSGGDVLLSTERLVGIEEFDRADGVCRVRAGTPVAELRSVALEHGWELPLDPPGERTTAGGCIAAAALGPRAHGYGTPRDLLLGLDVLLASGEHTRCGGRVVKNVTGYDLNKLYTGSFGTLGVIESLWLRLRPKPERSVVYALACDELSAASALVIAAGRRSSARAAALVGRPGAASRVVIELAGDAPSVESDAAWLEAECGARVENEAALESIRTRQAEVPEPFGLRFLIAVLPGRLAAALASLERTGATLLAYPGLCRVYAGFTIGDADEGAVARAFGAVKQAAAEAGGDYLCEAAPAWAKRGREMFGGDPALIPLFRALKQRFDPGGVLNPGRFAGGI